MDKKSIDLIIEHGTVLTMDPADRMIEDGAVAVQGNMILDVGTTEEIRRKYQSDQIIDATHKVVMPGLVDTYGHAGHGLVKGIHHPDHGWPSGPLYFHATTEKWWYVEGLLSGVERLRFGVTTGYTVVGSTPARMDSPVFAHRQAEAIEKIGIRGMLGVGPPDPYYSHLPEPWSGTLWQDGKPVKNPFTYQDALDNTIEILEKWSHKADERVQVSIHYPYLFGRQAAHPKIPFEYKPEEHVPLMVEKADEIKDVADRYNALIHSHIFLGSVQFGLQHYGKERVDHLLSGKVAFAHSNGLYTEEIEVLGRHKTGICVVPFTHENLFYGPCPVIELLQAGAQVTISTDGSAPYVSYDLFKDISRAIWTQWDRFKDQTLLPPGKALRMVTIEAAQALGLDHLVGSLESGKRADIILVDFNRPHLVPGELIPRQLAFYVNGNDVETVIVNGEILLQDRKVLSVNEQEIIEMAREEANLAFERHDISPYVEINESFWKNWKY